MGQFRDRMDDELRLRGYSASTRECYLRIFLQSGRRDLQDL